MKVLLIDNYDSFTYNLYQYAGEILKDNFDSFQLDVKRNDECSIDEIKRFQYNKIILSPGPGDPCHSSYFGVCLDILRELGSSIPILGICLGMQGMAFAFGGKVKRAAIPMHGKTSFVETDQAGVFANIPKQIQVMRYHSLIVEGTSLPNCFEISAWTVVDETKDKEIMGIRHQDCPMEGIQFHPESFATEAGQQMIGNFLGIE